MTLAASSMQSTKHRILVIDDDLHLPDIFKEALESINCVVDIAYNARDGLRSTYDARPDLILLDIMMPEMDGWEVCQRIRQMTNVPIIMVTALGDDDDIVKGLDMGADDYLVKPVPINELKARVVSLLRRAHNETTNSFAPIQEHAGLIIDHNLRAVIYEGTRISLSRTEFDLLACLFKYRKQTLTFEFLLTQIWGTEYKDDVGRVRLYISYLRKKLKTHGLPADMIHNEWGIGYRFD